VNNRSSRSPVSLRSALVLSALAVFPLGAATAAHADDLLGLYIGAAYGQSNIRARFDEVVPGSGGQLDRTDSAAFKGMVGVRLLSFFGAEVAYVDLGRRSGSGSGGPVAGVPFVTSAQASQKGEAAFALLYLPVPIVDPYIKVGLSRITTDMSAGYQINGAGAFAVRNFTDVGFAYGAGLQWKLGQWAVRGEYERFDAAGAHPSLLSIGMTYWLL
jgi:opacity protein-like surface antigen